MASAWIPGPEALAARAAHLAAIPFTRVTLVALLGALVVHAAARAGLGTVAHERLLVAASVAVLAALLGPALAAVVLGAGVLLWALVEAPLPRPLAALAVVALEAAIIVVPVVAVGWLDATTRELVAFFTNMAVLRVAAAAVDRWSERTAPQPLRRHLLAQLFFPTALNGPVEPLHALGGGWRAPDASDLRPGLARVAVGVTKMALVALALPPGWTEVLALAPRSPWWGLWAWAALLWIWFYLSFSGWSDVAIGVGRLCGRAVTENFHAPWRAADVGDFWRRWHVSLGLWLRDYVYVPLGGKRRHRAANVAVVFAVSAAWHVWGTLKILGLGFFPPRAWWGFACWGALHAAAVAFGPRGGGRVARAAALAFTAFAWMPFFAPASLHLATGLHVLLRMLWPWA